MHTLTWACMGLALVSLEDLLGASVIHGAVPSVGEGASCCWTAEYTLKILPRARNTAIYCYGGWLV